MSLKTFRLLIFVALSAAIVLFWNPVGLSAQTVTPTITLTPTQSLTPTITPPNTPTPTLTPTLPPATFSATLIINNDAPTFIDPLLSLTISSSTNSATLKGMRFSQDNGATWTNQEPFASSKQLALPADASWGDKTVTVEIRDLADNLATASATATYVSAQKASMQLKTNYSFIADLNYTTATINTLETVTIVNTTGDFLSTLNFSVPPKAFGEFTLKYVKVDGKLVTPTWSNNSNLVVDFGKNVRNNNTLTIEISFTDIAKSTLTELDSRLSKTNGVMEVSQWFPIISDGHGTRNPSDSQYTLVSDNFHLELTLNTAMPRSAFAAPGSVSYPTTKKRIVDFGPARDFAFSVCPSCVSTTGSIDGISVTVHYTSGNAGTTALKNALDSLHTFNTKFAQYPYKTFVIAQSTKYTDEYPGLIFVGPTKLSSLSYVRHETAHQWFYGMLGNDQINEPWLDEAFAEWAGLGFAAHNYDSDLPVSTSANYFPDKDLWSNWGAHNSYGQTIYYKGASFIAGVRSRMGETAFWNSMKNLFPKYRFGVITTPIVAQNWLDYTSVSKKDSLLTYMKNYIGI